MVDAGWGRENYPKCVVHETENALVVGNIGQTIIKLNCRLPVFIYR